MMPSIAENIKRICDEVRALETEHQRPPHSVRLLAVSKNHPASRIREAWDAGHREFGESYAQEAIDKIQLLDLEGATWHFIGPMQSNKTRDIAHHFDWVHSIDRLKIARRLNEQRPETLPPLKVCIQINISGESSKSGVSLADASALCEAIDSLPRLELRGLMAIPAPGGDFEQQRANYRPIAALLKELSVYFKGMDTLSIGMSDDYAAAIAEGATIIRLGTALFGPRNR